MTVAVIVVMLGVVMLGVVMLGVVTPSKGKLYLNAKRLKKT